MQPGQPSRASLGTRVSVLTAAPVLLGCVAHTSAGGGTPAVEAVVVVAVLVCLLGIGLLSLGRAADRAMGTTRPGVAEQVAALTALAIGQLIVHWQLIPAVAVVPGSPGHLHGPGAGLGTGTTSVHAHVAGSTAMLAGHVAVAIAVGICLGWLESFVLRCRRVLVGLRARVELPGRTVALVVAVVLTAPVIRARLRWGALPSPASCPDQGPLSRRGPPALRPAGT